MTRLSYLGIGCGSPSAAWPRNGYATAAMANTNANARASTRQALTTGLGVSDSQEFCYLPGAGAAAGAGAAVGLVPKSTFGATEIAFSFSTVNCGLTV